MKPVPLKAEEAQIEAPTSTAYSELQQVVDLFNTKLFEGKLPSCLVTLQRQANTLGYYSHKRFTNSQNREQFTDELAVNPEYFGAIPLLEILQTVAHELCHMWQTYHGTPGRGRYHNLQWSEKMIEIGLMPSDTGEPGGKRTGDHLGDYVLEDGPFIQVVRDLLATGFKVTWLDCRLPNLRVRTYTPPFLQENEAPEMLAALIPPVVRQREELKDAEDHAEGDPFVKPPSPLMQAETPANASKTKFSCLDCELQGIKTHAWGKPTLKIACALHEPPVLMHS